MDHHSVPSPSLIFNRSFIRTFIAEQSPCFALGMLEVESQQCGVLALSFTSPLPDQISAKGFNFGHSLWGTSQFEVIHLSFEFYGYQTYNTLINPNNAIVQTVLKQMMDTGDYFFLALNGVQGGATLFRSELGKNALSHLTENYQHIQTSTTTDEQYLQASIAFLKDPQPAGPLLRWVCNDKVEYLDLTTDRLDMNPA